MNPTEVITAAASTLRQARLHRTPVPPASAKFGLSELADAYRVAEINTAARVAEGRRIVGKKIGLTAKAVQQQLGVDQPDFGVLFDDMEFLHGADIPTERLIQPKVEAEVAFVVERDIDGEAPTYGEFLNGLAYALPALEIVDSAITDWKITLFDTVADNASSGLYVLGDQPVTIGALSLGDLGMAMTSGGETVSVGTGAACLGHPLRAAYWLARTMAAQGQGLKAGEVILSGALGPMVPVQAGDLIDAHIAALGRVACRIV